MSVNESKESGPEKSLDRRIEFVTGDITDIEVEAIVCPSLPDLDVLYTGVAGAIMRKGGDKIFAEARAIGEKAIRENPEEEFPVPLCSAHLTNAGNLPKTKHVIHSIVVDFTENELGCDAAVVFKSAWNVLEVADANRLNSVAFPALGAGVYQVPLEQSFGAIAQAADRFFKEYPKTSLKNIKLVTFNPKLPKPSLIEELMVDQLVRTFRDRNN